MLRGRSLEKNCLLENVERSRARARPKIKKTRRIEEAAGVLKRWRGHPAGGGAKRLAESCGPYH